jgi:hypothetical protein
MPIPLILQKRIKSIL